MCYNTIGSYECRCKPGYNGNPVSLLGCIDVNECQMSDHYCGPNAECQNFVGGYNCVCQPGYERRGKKGHCKDINECKEMPCHKAAMCYNLPGTFTCTCIEGYSGDGFDCQGQKFV
uniref:EGF-like domain-containing protein n=1 Tax=Romanomermis culicivorax TaxID=13658 RepID=A0A915K841_ROMCU